MKIMKMPDTVGLVVTDVDKTLYNGESGDRYIADGTAGEIAFMASYLDVSEMEAQEILSRKREELAQGGMILSISHAVYALGVSFKDWSRIRCACYFPEEYLTSNLSLAAAVSDSLLPLAAVTNSPREVGRRVLITLGLAQELRLGKIHIFGPEDFGVSKPDPQIYIRIADKFAAPLAECISIGDHEYKDCRIPLDAGYGGAIQVTGPEDFIQILADLRSQP